MYSVAFIPNLTNILDDKDNLKVVEEKKYHWLLFLVCKGLLNSRK